jgi:hypothetical protein
MNGKFTFGLTLALIAVLAPLSPIPAGADGTAALPGLSPTKGPCDLGVIFNTSDLLLGLESYQGALGAEIGWDGLALRGLFDFTINGSSETLGAELGAAFVYHLVTGVISPYVGASASGAFMTTANVTSAWTFTLGSLAGVEVLVLDFLSIFAEYEIGADLVATTNLQSSQTTFDYLIATRMGNNAKIGVVIYFMRSGAKSK